MYLRCRQMLGHFSLSHATVRSSRCNIPRALCGGWWVGHDIMMWSADSSFAPHSQVGVNAIPRLCIVARKRPTPVLSLLSLTQAGLGKIRIKNYLFVAKTKKACNKHTHRKKSKTLENFLRQRDCERPLGHRVKQPP